MSIERRIVAEALGTALLLAAVVGSGFNPAVTVAVVPHEQRSP